MKLFVMLLLLSSAFTNAQAEDFRTPVYVGGQQDNLIGDRFVYHLKEGIRGSRGMRLVGSQEESLVQAHITTIDSYDDNRQLVYSVVLTVTNLGNPETFPLFVDSLVGACGEQRIPSCAEKMIAATGKQADKIMVALDWAKKEKKVLPKTTY